MTDLNKELEDSGKRLESCNVPSRLAAFGVGPVETDITI